MAVKAAAALGVNGIAGGPLEFKVSRVEEFEVKTPEAEFGKEVPAPTVAIVTAAF